MDKKRRNELTQLKYKKRIRIFVANIDIYICRDGRQIRNPRTIDIIKDGGQRVYKSTSTPCSCYMCSGEYKYRRHDKKKEDRRLLQEHANN